MSDKVVQLRNKIEAMNKHQQIEILKIFSNAKPSVTLNENNNGTFVNLTSLPPHIISKIETYVQYIEEQRTHLMIAEREMERLDNTYFKCNKETENTKI